MLKYQEANSLMPSAPVYVDKGKDKVVEDVVEAASNDVEGFVTPKKRLSMADSEDDETPSFQGTQKSTNKVALKMIKMEKPDKP